MELYIIIDKGKQKALYGRGGATLMFSTEEIAKEVADQFFEFSADYIILGVNLLENLPHFLLNYEPKNKKNDT